ncbi:MAG: hypothetical protein OEQ30_10855 [Gammaproteobacteria bacterium]|jgi:hypothetical protein|nr:hypothetical protein [Gammaproteobacteria bacterium]MDH3756425.1 hypothetical protein [Gammaproteobacteria bacterium]MDH3846781.1 hypothetical protein [Gammaproteobacteria bacterium]MDH3862688.1 hypothetical protein [Gammaproteobacteria bacterium]MDH3904269.1 hypothetical protein [Gammaproteobacteria bacterium]
MFKAARIAILLFILFMVATGTWLTKLRSTDWNNSLWVKIYPINGDGSEASEDYITGLSADTFAGIEKFLAREVRRYGRSIERPVRLELGEPISEQPPAIASTSSMLDVVLWSLKMRWWVSGVTDDQDRIDPDVRIFVRYHSPKSALKLDDSVGVQKGMFGVVNAYSSRRLRGRNNVVIAHEFLHTLGATDKYDRSNGMPIAPHGLAEPDRSPLYPQTSAEIMGGRIPLAIDDAITPASLSYVIIGPLTAEEIRLAE